MTPVLLTLGPITFLAPLALLGLLALPLIWWILRVTPPTPKNQTFPPLRILKDVMTEEETPNSTPLWLLLFRLFLISLIAIALARPLIFEPEGQTDRPLVLIIDNGWDAASNWQAAINDAENRLSEARRKNLETVVLTAIAPEPVAEFGPAQDSLKQIESLGPRPLPPDYKSLATSLGALDLSQSNVVWLSGGLAFDGAEAVSELLRKSPNPVRLTPTSETIAIFPGKAEETANGFRSVWHRADGRSLRTTDITAHSRDGRILARESLTFAPGDRTAEVSFDLPTELRTRITALRAADSASAASVKLFDDSWGRPLVGIVEPEGESGSPLLSETFYANSALQPYADIFSGSVNELLALSPSVLVMTDESRAESDQLNEFVENGGLLIRFAGPKLAKRPDALLPVPLRSGGREFGGALTWEDPQKLAPFSKDSPFFGLKIPDEITVKRQVMAEPGAETDARTWARLEDGSPVVTSDQFGFGRIVLFHVTAGPEWSNLAIGGLYVDMLRRMLGMARSSPSQTQTSDGDWAPERVLNGFGRLEAPDIFAKPIADADFNTTSISQAHPPGLYRLGARRKALNTVSAPEDIQILSGINGIKSGAYGQTKSRTLGGMLLTLALILLAIDAVFALIVSGRIGYLKPSRLIRTSATILVAGMFLIPNGGLAQDPGYDEAALDLYLAYVETGDARTNQLSEAALSGLVDALNRRTTIEPKGVRSVNLETDILVYYPFLYWPVDRNESTLSANVSAKLNDYMASGGTIVFDTQDHAEQSFLGGNPHPGLAKITENLDIPNLMEVPEDHVLTKSFYLLQVFPGRWANGRVWVDQNTNGAARDGVSSVVIGSNDWAAGWAQDENNIPLVDLEREIPNQREMSLRFGVNLAMFALAGNYKTDQVHSAALVERLGRQQLEPRNLGPSGDRD